jgi:uncharacterized protein (TIGR02145 family)
MKKIYANCLLVFSIISLSLLFNVVNAQHFNFVGGYYGHPIWTLYLQGITLDGVDLEAGDEIAIFDGETMVGVFILTQVCTPDNMDDNVLEAFYTLNSGPGYTPGNPVFFKCWDASEGFEGTEFTVQYYDYYGGAWTENIFPEGDGQYSIAEISFTPISGQQQIELSEGFSFISSHIITENPDMLAVMASILNENLDFIRNSQGQTLRKIGPNWINGIGDWIIEEGYLIKVLSDDSFTMEGDVVDPVTPISLELGYQFISYFPDIPIDALIAFESILSDNLAFIRNSNGDMLLTIGPYWVNGIGDCNPGEGYLVRMFDAAELIYPAASSFTCGDPFTDPRDGQTYNTVQIGTQCWMAENLNIGEMINGGSNMTNNGVIEKYCYNNDPANCETYGGLYQWDEMMEYTTTQGVQGICPSGWYLPTDGEWTTVTDFLGGENVAGGKMKETGTTHWYPPNAAATNESGFTALPGGYYYGGSFYGLGSFGNWWSSTEYSSTYAWRRNMSYVYGTVYRVGTSKTTGFSACCLRN